MTSQLSSGRSLCQNGQEDEESSAYYTGTATAASLGSRDYLDNCWPRLICTPISDSYLTPLEEQTTGPCRAALGFQYCSQCPIILLCWRRVLCLLHRAAHALQRHYCALFSPPPGIGWMLTGKRQWKYFQWQDMIWKKKRKKGKNGRMICSQREKPPVLTHGNQIHDEKWKTNVHWVLTWLQYWFQHDRPISLKTFWHVIAEKALV